MHPPWQAHPEIPAGSIGWRMRAGEEYWLAFRAWLLGFDEIERARFIAAHPWDGFFSRLG